MADTPKIIPSTAGGDDAIVPYEDMREGEDYRPETPDEAEERGPDEEWKFWDGMIKGGLINERRWREEALEAETIYFGPDNDPGAGGVDGNTKTEEIDEKTSMIHANIDVLRPLLFSQAPTPIARRRFRGDGKADPVDTIAAETAQRLCQYMIDTTDFAEVVKAARDDWLIAGRGAARAYYAAEFEEVLTGEVDAEGNPLAAEVKTFEEVYVRHIEWRRLVTAPAHSWVKMPWLAMEVPMTRGQVKARFGKEKCDDMAFDTKGLMDSSKAITDEDRDTNHHLRDESESGDPGINAFDTAMVWEIWSKETGEVIWFSPSYKKGILDKIEDPLMLEKFWPMPKPLLATTKGQQMTPRPDVKYYMRRAEEVNLASKKLQSILKVISVSALYPGAMADKVDKLLNGDNVMIAVENWIGLMEKGGTQQILQWLPLQQIMAAVQALVALREQSKQAMFEHSGVSDIMRAQGDPNETATAQQLKGRYAGVRLQDRQTAIGEFARDLLRIMVEIGLEQFDTQTIADVCGMDFPLTEMERQQYAMFYEQTMAQHAQMMQLHQMLAQAIEAGVEPGPLPPAPPPPDLDEPPLVSWEAVHDRLRTDYMRKITVSIETDSTILADEQADKEARIEFLNAFAGFVQQIAPLAGTGQFPAKTVKELLLFGVRSFPKSRTLESMIAEIPDEPTQEQAPDVAVQVANIRAEVDMQLKQLDLQDKQAEREHELRMKGVDVVTDAAKMAGEPAATP